MISLSEFAHFKPSRAEINLSIGEQYQIKNYQQKINDLFYLVAIDTQSLLFINSNNRTLEIKYTLLNNYKIFKDDINLAPTIQDNFWKKLIKRAAEQIYENHLRGQRTLELNNIFYEFVSSYKLILKELQEIYFKSDLKLEITKGKEYIIWWTKLL